MPLVSMSLELYSSRTMPAKNGVPLSPISKPFFVLGNDGAAAVFARLMSIPRMRIAKGLLDYALETLFKHASGDGPSVDSGLMLHHCGDWFAERPSLQCEHLRVRAVV